MTLPLGALARDTITGYKGIITARTEWLNGCWRVVLQAQQLHDGRPVEAQSFDAHNVEIVNAKPDGIKTRLEDAPSAAAAVPSEAPAPAPAPARRTGGPQREPSTRRDPSMDR